jgi:hypothetical protein
MKVQKSALRDLKIGSINTSAPGKTLRCISGPRGGGGGGGGSGKVQLWYGKFPILVREKWEVGFEILVGVPAPKTECDAGDPCPGIYAQTARCAVTVLWMDRHLEVALMLKRQRFGNVARKVLHDVTTSLHKIHLHLFGVYL